MTTLAERSTRSGAHSVANWTFIPAKTGHPVRVKLDASGVALWVRSWGFTFFGSGCQTGAFIAQRVAPQVDLVGVMNKPVEDGVGQGGIADGGMPVLDRQLIGHDS